MRILFVLPSRGNVPIGGFKVVYEYANRLIARGHEISILHPLYNVPQNLKEDLKSIAKYYIVLKTKNIGPEAWFPLDPKVRLLYCPSLAKAVRHKTDIVVATSWRTADFVARFPIADENKYYLIQSCEDWDGPKAQVLGTWKLPLQKIVISKDLLKVAEQLKETATLIPYGLDPQEFGIDILPKNRSRIIAGMLFHQGAVKGTQDGIRALHLVHEKIPNLTVRLFGVYHTPHNLAPWMTYQQLPTRKQLRELYNQCQIFLSPSLVEGLALPPLEAMLSGTALVATEIGGHTDYAEEMKTALLAPPGQPEKLAERMKEILTQPNLRIKLAYAGRDRAQKFNWDDSVTKLEDLFLRTLH